MELTMETIMNKANHDLKVIEHYINFESTKNTYIYLHYLKEKMDSLYEDYKKSIYLKSISFRPTKKYKYKTKQMYVYKKKEHIGKMNILKTDSLRGKIYENGILIYEGNMENELSHGQGKSYYNGELDYEGQWYYGLKQGQGKSYYNGKVTYDGNWEDNLHHGEGAYYEDGELSYDGEWEYNLRYGQGLSLIHI